MCGEKKERKRDVSRDWNGSWLLSRNNGDDDGCYWRLIWINIMNFRNIVSVFKEVCCLLHFWSVPHCAGRPMLGESISRGSAPFKLPGQSRTRINDVCRGGRKSAFVSGWENIHLTPPPPSYVSASREAISAWSGK